VGREIADEGGVGLPENADREWWRTGYQLRSDPVVARIDSLIRLLSEESERERGTADVLTPTDAALVLRVPTKTIVELCRRGEVAARKVGRRWRIPRWAVEDFFSAVDRRSATSSAPEAGDGSSGPIALRSREQVVRASSRAEFLEALRALDDEVP